jgi:hypothetical protein
MAMYGSVFKTSALEFLNRRGRRYLGTVLGIVSSTVPVPLCRTMGVTLDEIRCSSARRVRKPRIAFQQT